MARHLRLLAGPTGDDLPPEQPASAPEQAGAPPGFAAIYREHSRFVANLTLRLLGRDAEVDDVVQDVFLAALRGLGRLQNQGATRAWLATVTTRVVRRRLRLRRLRTFLGLEALFGDDAPLAQGVDPEQAALLARAYAELDRMPVNQRLAWTLRHVEGEQLDRVAELCGCSLATVKRRIGAAQAQLEQVLGSGERPAPWSEVTGDEKASSGTGS